MSNTPKASREERALARRKKRQQRKQSWKWLLALTAAASLAVTGILVAQHQARDRPAPPPKKPVIHPVFPGLGKNLADVTLVVYNSSDPNSEALAKFYAGKRGIAADQVVGLKCSQEEEISREDYDKTIADPLRAIFDARNWWRRSSDHLLLGSTSNVSENRIRFVALIRGMPLKIRATPTYEGDPGNNLPSPIKEQNAASVDSELAVLARFTKAISGFIPNPYYRAYKRITDGAYPRLMLVTRLDAPTVSMVERMINDSLAAEETGLWGRCYLDTRGFAHGSSPLAEGDDWINAAFTDTMPYVFPTVIDKRPEMFSREYPMSETAFYFGWYSENVSGPFTRPEFRFEPGAVACHIHSFSALTVRDPSHHWVGPLLDRGVTATLGNVYEPYLTLTTHLDLFAARLFDGLTLAESAYAATQGLSWMNVVIGDPLYRPGKAFLDLNSELVEPAAMDLADGNAERAALITEGRAYWRGAQVWKTRGAAEGSKALEKSARELHSGRIFEGLGLLRAAAGDGPGASVAFEAARAIYKDPLDGARVVLDEAQTLANAGQKSEALELLRTNKPRYANQVVGAALDQLEAALSATP